MNMKNMKQHNPILILLLLVAVAAFLRMFIGIPNVSPIAAIALFGATYIKRKELAVVLPLVILLISDIIIGLYSPLLMIGVYSSFVFIALLGFVLRRNVNVATVIGSSLISSVIFFLVTNFVVWAEGIWYPLTVDGLIRCYVMALPFFKYEVAGTLVFSGLFFVTYALVFRFSPKQAEIKV